MKTIKFNTNLKNVNQANSIYWNQLATERKKKNKNFTILSLGEAFLKPKKININKFMTSENFHYSSSRGILELRKKISSYYNKYHKTKVLPESEIMISAGSKILTFMTILALLNKNENIYTFEPAWLSYKDQAKILGHKLKFLSIDTKLEDLNKKIDKNCKIFILNNPNNPSGRLYSTEYLKKLIKILYKRNILLICDEAYSQFIAKPNIFTSIIEFKKYKKNIILINSFSKNFSMSGWRIGFVISNKKIIDKLLILNQHLITCAPTILQHYISSNFQKLLTHNEKEIKKLMLKRHIVKNELIKKKIDFIEGNSTFYFFIKIPNRINPGKLCKYFFFKKNISYVPGKSYGEKSEHYLRISIGTESIKKIKIFINFLSRIYNDLSFKNL